MLSLAGIEDVYTSATGHTRTMGNFIKAAYFALEATYGYLSPELWPSAPFKRALFDEHAKFLKDGKSEYVAPVEEVQQ